MVKIKKNNIERITDLLIKIISETNGVSLINTLELLSSSEEFKEDPELSDQLLSFKMMILNHNRSKSNIQNILEHPISSAFFNFFNKFPLRYHEEHIHLTGSLTSDFIYPHLSNLLDGEKKTEINQALKKIYGKAYTGIESSEDINKLIKLNNTQFFSDYLKILYLPKLILTSKEIHTKAAYHMASELYNKYNIGKIRLKFTLSRANNLPSEYVPGIDQITPEKVLLGLYEGFKKFQKEHKGFDFSLAPCFRKESNFFDKNRFKNKAEDFDYQVKILLELLDKHPELQDHLMDVDTVGDEKNLYRKSHFDEMRSGFRRLQYKGFRIRSHHGETFKTLQKGVQSVDNAMNIWRINTLEHGISLGINPNFYFHRIYQQIIEKNKQKIGVSKNSYEYNELVDMNFKDETILKKILEGRPLNASENTQFLKQKFHQALEVEHYQHDVLNHMISKGVALISLPTSNFKLTDKFSHYKDHPFSWWEKKGLKLGIGTDNYITLNTNFIKEMLIVLFSDPENLKITKLLMMATREHRRSYISNLLWDMRKKSNIK